MSDQTLHADKPVLALVIRLFSILAIAVIFAIVKYLNENGVHVVESLFYRYLLGAIFIGGWMIIRYGPSSFKTNRLSLHFVRALVGMVAMGLNFTTVTVLPLAEAATISFAIPLISTVLSVFILSEIVGMRRWVAIIIGFVGVLIAVQPGQNVIPLNGVLFGLGGALAASYTMILVRKLATTETATTIVFYYMILATPVLGCAMFWFGKWHSAEIFGLLLFLGVLGVFAMWGLSESLRLANVAVVMPMDYTNLIFSTILGVYIWERWPAQSVWFGVPLIIGSGIYIGYRERKRKRELASGGNADASDIQ